MGAVTDKPRECLRCKEIETFCGCTFAVYDAAEYIEELEEKLLLIRAKAEYRSPYSQFARELLHIIVATG